MDELVESEWGGNFTKKDAEFVKRTVLFRSPWIMEVVVASGNDE